MPDAYTPPPPETWTFLSDRVMGGVSDGRVTVEPGPDGPVLHLSGTVSTENRGGFIQTRVALDAPLPAGARGVVLRVKGDGQRYFVHIRTRGSVLPWQFYQAPFDTDGQWQEVRLPFEAFAPRGGLLRARLRPETVESVGIAAYGRDHVADLRAVWTGLF